MLETMRNIGKLIVAVWVGMWGFSALFAAVAVLAAAVDLFVLGDVELFFTHLLVAGIIGGVIFCAVWMHHDAATELKNLQIQKEELKVLESKDAPQPDVPTKDPWLYP